MSDRQTDLTTPPVRIARAAVAGLLAVGFVRACGWLVGAIVEFSAVDRPFHLEGAYVFFAWCVQHGLPLYPEGAGPSYVVNYMGPAYFWLVGMLGRLIDADIPTLYRIGRAVTLLCGIGPAVIAAAYLRNRYGRLAALVALVFGLGAGPMIGYGLMCRPDMMADLLGAAGFFLACRREGRWSAAVVLCLAGAILTKQTAAVWLLAACAALLVNRETWRRALAVGASTAALVAAIIAALAMTSEPHIVSSLFGHGAVAMDPVQRIGILLLLVKRSPELLVFAALGCGLWSSRKYKDSTLWILTIVWLIAIVYACGKRGSDLNYFIPLRVVESLAAGTLCIAVLRTERYRGAWACLALLAALATLPSTAIAVNSAKIAVEQRATADTPQRQAEQKRFQRLAVLANDPKIRLLTDSDRLAIYQGTRAVLLDMYLFRLQVESGRLDPKALLDQLERRQFQYVVLSADASGDYHDIFFYRLPQDVAASIQKNYRLQSDEAGWFVYVPRDANSIDPD